MTQSVYKQQSSQWRTSGQWHSLRGELWCGDTGGLYSVWEPLQLGDPGNNYVCTVSDWLKMRGWNEKLCYLFFPRRDRMKLEHDYFPPFFEMKGNEEWDIRQLCLGFLWPSVSPSLWSLWPYEFTVYVCVYICLYVYIYFFFIFIFFSIIDGSSPLPRPLLVHILHRLFCGTWADHVKETIFFFFYWLCSGLVVSMPTMGW